MTLTADKIPSPFGRDRWNTKAIAQIVKDPSYKGDAFQTDHFISLNIKVRSKSDKTYTKRIKGNPKPVGESTPPIVSVELWDDAQAALKKRYKPSIPALRVDTWL